MINVANSTVLPEPYIRERSGVRPPPRWPPFPAKAAREIARSPQSARVHVTSREGKALVLRQIEPADAGALQRFFDRLTPQEVRMRFLHPINALSDTFARQLCELDPNSEVAWVLAEPDDAQQLEIYGVARAHLDLVVLQAEFAIVVQGRFAGQGIGTALMRHVIETMRKLGATELWSDVLVENDAILALCKSLGFTRSMAPHNAGIFRVTLTL